MKQISKMQIFKLYYILNKTDEHGPKETQFWAKMEQDNFYKLWMRIIETLLQQTFTLKST